MRQLYKAIFGALLVLGLAGIVSEPATAAMVWDSVCNCRRPDSQYNTRQVVRGAPQVNTRTRYVDHTREVKKTKLVQENRLVVHVKPVINREIVVHRQNTVVRNITLHKVNTTNRIQPEYRNETVARQAQGWTRVVNETRQVRGVNCNCGPNRDGRTGGEVVSYRY